MTTERTDNRSIDQARAEANPWRARWDERLRDSVAVSLSISQWHPHLTLTPQRLERLGVRLTTPEAQGAFNRVVKAGKIDLIPADAYLPVTRAAAAARAHLRGSSHSLMGSYIITPRAWTTWQRRNNDEKAAFFQARDFICENLADLVNQMRTPYRAIFADTYDRLTRAGLLAPAAGWIEEAISDLVNSVPNAEYIRSRYDWTEEYKFVPMADEIEESEAKALQTRAERLMSADQLGKDRAQILAQMQTEVSAQVERRRAQVEESLAAAEVEFYRGLSETVAELKNTLTDKGALGGRGALQLRNLIDRVRTLNIFEDDRLEEQMTALERAIDARSTGPVAGRDQALAMIRQGLDATAVQVRNTLRELPNRRGVRIVTGAEDDETPDQAPARQVQRLALEPEPEPEAAPDDDPAPFALDFTTAPGTRRRVYQVRTEEAAV